MKKFSLKSLAMSAAALFISAHSASAADVLINLGYAASEGSSYSVLADKFEELAGEHTADHYFYGGVLSAGNQSGY